MKEKIKNFFTGRYGNDEYGLFLIIIALVFSVISIVAKNGLISIVSYVLWFYEIFRMCSRNIYKRREENLNYLKLTEKIRKKRMCIAKGMKDKEHKYFVCPKCAKIVRVPKGKGKIEITCPECGYKFDKKS